jgi:hypothetical protein
MHGRQDDPSRAPDPEGGWSRRIVTVKEALVVPATVPDMIQPMGVFDAAGSYVHEAVLWRGRRLMVEPERPEPVAHLPGRWIWGGVLLNHFGHFLVESTSRLWAVDAVEGPVDGLVFTVKRETAEEAGQPVLQPFQRLFFELLGIGMAVKILAEPTRVEQLEVPGQGFGLGEIARGTAPFRQFFQTRFARDIAAEGPEKLYISRSALGAGRGGVIGEEHIEQALEAAGYEVFHPQKASLPTQIARYKAARQIVALDGSALHMVAMVAGPGQQVGMIKRRDSAVSVSIVHHLSAFMGHPPAVFDQIVQDWVRSDRKRADRHSIGELNLAALGADLVAAGFLPAGTTIAGLSAEEVRAAVSAFEVNFRGKLSFEPVPRGSGWPQRGPERGPERGADAPQRLRKDKADKKDKADDKADKAGKKDKPLKGEERRAARMARRAAKDPARKDAT